jgi:hypothetical protein
MWAKSCGVNYEQVNKLIKLKFIQLKPTRFASNKKALVVKKPMLFYAQPTHAYLSNTKNSKDEKKPPTSWLRVFLL